jgi:hypothetical protein
MTASVTDESDDITHFEGSHMQQQIDNEATIDNNCEGDEKISDARSQEQDGCPVSYPNAVLTQDTVTVNSA